MVQVFILARDLLYVLKINIANATEPFKTVV